MQMINKHKDLLNFSPFRDFINIYFLSHEVGFYGFCLYVFNLVAATLKFLC